jgi:hypothetical protein
VTRGTLSEAIKIMGFMQKDQHIDPELFALLLRTNTPNATCPEN